MIYLIMRIMVYFFCEKHNTKLRKKPLDRRAISQQDRRAGISRGYILNNKMFLCIMKSHQRKYTKPARLAESET